MKNIGIVGAGIAGLFTGWRLAAAGHRVTLYEKGQVGKQGASPFALGGLVPFGEHVTGNIARIQRESLRQWPAWVAELAKTTGTPLSEFYRSWTLPDGQPAGQLRIPMVLELLKKAVEIHGGEVREHTDIIGYEPLLERYEQVVLAAGWYNRVWVPGGRAWTLDTAQGIRIQPPAGYMPPFIYAEKTYVMPDFEGSVLVGGKQVNSDFPLPRVSEELLATAIRLDPKLAGSTLLHAWVGGRPMGAPKLPLVRAVESRVHGVAALGRIGYCLAPAVAQAVAEEVAKS